MSMSNAGVWAVGVWAQTVWADDVWYESGGTPVDGGSVMGAFSFWAMFN